MDTKTIVGEGGTKVSEGLSGVCPHGMVGSWVLSFPQGLFVPISPTFFSGLVLTLLGS